MPAKKKPDAKPAEELTPAAGAVEDKAPAAVDDAPPPVADAAPVAVQVRAVEVAEVLALIGAERDRQIEEEGHTPEKDDTATCYELPRAAVCYAMRGAGLPPAKAAFYWPWQPVTFKPRDDDSDLVRAAALIVAELQRRARARAAV